MSGRFVVRTVSVELRVTLSAMLEELESNRLTVVVAPAPSPIHEGHGVRCVCEKNAAWYRSFCASFVSSRRRRSSKTDTAIRRRETVKALRGMIAGEPVGPVYGPRLLDAARGYWKRNADNLRERIAMESFAAA